MLRRDTIIPICILRSLVVCAVFAAVLGLSDTSPATAGGILSADLSFYGDASFAGMGRGLSEAGDVDGDGYSDFAVANEGSTPSVRIYYGSSNGPNQFSYSEIPSPAPGVGSTTVEFGLTIAAGDIDNDGYCDLVIGAPGSSHPFLSTAGTVYVFMGSATGIHTTPDQTITGTVANLRFGNSLCPAGDLNSDGFYDFAISQYGSGAKVQVYTGGTALLEDSGWSYATTGGSARVDAAGDVNADGYDDLLLGDPTVYHGVGSADGSAYVFFGSDKVLSAIPGWEWYNSNTNFAAFPSAVAGAGDVNGDGYADILIADHLHKVLVGSFLESRGRAMLFLGGPSGPSYGAFWDHTADTADTFFGWDISPAGDTNGDGYADFLVASRLSGVDFGRVDLYLGSPTTITPSGQYWVAPIYGNSWAAYTRIVAAGDVDGDGFGDWILADHQLSSQGRVDIYLGHGDLPSTVGAWSLLGGSGSAHLGAAMAADGDANLDGFSDLLVGQPGLNWGKGGAGNGGVELYYGSSAGPVSSGWALTGTSSGDSLGAEVAFVGDTDGDNAGELAIGAPYKDLGGTVSLYPASSGGPGTIAYRTLSGTQADESFGRSIAGIGDVDGDGYADVVVGSPDWDGTSTNNGRVQLFLGSASGLSTSAAWQWSRGGRTGWDCTFGDFNRDGFSDLAVSSPTAAPDLSTLLGGVVDIFYGSASGFAALPDLKLINGESMSTFGWVVTTAGDLDGDGFEELAISAPKYGYAASGMTYGRAYVFFGSPTGLPANPAWWEDGASSPSEQYGLGLAGVGDLNGDGADELAVGSLDGYVHIFRGYVGAGLATSPSLTLLDPTGGTEFGRVIAGRSNGDGDVFSDFFVGRPLLDGLLGNTDAGGALWYRGGTGEIANVALDRSARQIGSVTTLARLGRSPNNSMTVQTTLRSPAGATDLRLQTRHALLSDEIITAPAQNVGSWVHARNISEPSVLNGLSTLSPYHWQVRGVTRNPRFPHTPWRTMAGASVNLAHFRTGGTVLRPDLVAASATPDTTSNLGDVILAVEVLNQGLGPAGATHARISLDGTLQCDNIVTAALGVGASTFLNCNLGQLSAGTHTVSVIVDVLSEALESDEANNTAAFQIQVIAPTYLLVRPDGNGDVPTIATAFSTIAAGGVVELADGTFTGTGNHSLNPAGKDLTLRSQSGNAAACVIDAQADANATRRILLLENGESAAFRIQNITFTGGYNTGTGGAIRMSGSAATIEGCRFVGNHSGSGAGVYAINAPTLNFTNCEFLTNDCTNAGAGVYLNTTPSTFSGCTFRSNTSTWGGAVYIHSAPSTITGCLFADNVNPHYGGAVEVNYAAAIVDVDQSTFHSNGSPDAAHFYLRNGATLNLHGSILSGGTQGDPISCANGTEVVNIDCSDVWGNSAGDFVGCIAGADLDPLANNFSSDPYYCDAGGGLYTLDTASVCSAANSLCGSRVGAFDTGCTVVATEPVPELWRFGLDGAHPNPFNPRTSVRFQLEDRGPVDLTIYDVAGRRVRKLLQHEPFEAGVHEVIWDGTDDHRNAVGSGVYFVFLNNNGREDRVKVALVR